MKLTEKISQINQKYQISMMLSIIASIVMTVVHIVLFFTGKSVFYIGVIIFSIVFLAVRLICYRFNKKKENDYRQSIYSFPLLLLAISAMPATFFWAIYRKGDLNLPYEWLIYGYAAYAFFKLISSFILFRKTRKNKGSLYEKNCRDLSFMSALITFFMFETAMISHYYGENVDALMRAIEIVSHILVILASYYIAFCFLFRGIKQKALDIAAKGKEKIHKIKGIFRKKEAEIIEEDKKEIE